MRFSPALLSLVLTSCTGGTAEQQPANTRSGSATAPMAGPGSLPTRTYYVTPRGSDRGKCSEQAPCRSLQRAAKVASEAGSLVLVADGEYAGFRSEHDSVTFRASGKGALISSGYPGDEGPARDNIKIENDGVVLEGFVVRNGKRAGITVLEARDVVVRNNRVGPSGKWGIFTGFAVGVQIIDNETFGSKGEHGIYVSNSRDDDDRPVIRGNVSHHNNFSGIQLNGDCESGGDGKIDGALLENNLIYENNYKGLSIIAAPGIVIQNNLVHDNGIKGGAAGIHLTNQPDCDASQATNAAVVVNNTVVEPRIAALRITDDATRNLVFNNIFVSKKRPVADEVGGSHIAASNVRASSSRGLFAADFALAAGGRAAAAGDVSFKDARAPQMDRLGKKREASAPGLGAIAH
jgi:parallel beta-helix repeat protein